MEMGWRLLLLWRFGGRIKCVGVVVYKMWQRRSNWVLFILNKGSVIVYIPSRYTREYEALTKIYDALDLI